MTTAATRVAELSFYRACVAEALEKRSFDAKLQTLEEHDARLAALEERVNVLEGDLSEARRDAESAKAAEAAARIELQKLSAAFDKQQASQSQVG